MRCALTAPVATVALLATAAAVAGTTPAPPAPAALELRDLGIAELENERPAEAEKAFRRLTEVAGTDPLPWANLAIALLRQQKFPEAQRAIGEAHKRSPENARVVAIEAEIHQWSGDPAGALETFRRAAALAPEDREVQYGLYRQASTMEGDEASAAAAQALERLARLRPENLEILLEGARAAIARGDRAAATAALLRVRELAWQAPAGAEELLGQALAALEAGDVAAANLPTRRLTNVLKVTPMYKEGLRELAPGIQGMPLLAFAAEPPPRAFGEPVALRFVAASAAGGAGGDVVAADLDGDEAPELARLVDGPPRRLEILPLAGGEPAASFPAAGVERLLVADLDNDGFQDLIGYGAGAVRLWRGGAAGPAADSAAELGLGEAGGAGAEALDYDIEGDLDLLLLGPSRPELWRNALDGPLSPVGERSLPRLELEQGRDAFASDLDRDGDVDLLLAHGGGLIWLDNLRQGRFRDRTAEGGLAAARGPLVGVRAADLDNDGWPEIVSFGQGLALWRNEGGVFAPWDAAPGSSALVHDVELLDADNDGYLDIAVAAEGGTVVLANRGGSGFEFVPGVEAAPDARQLAVVDLDADGDLDLVASGPSGIERLENRGGNRNRWLVVRLRGLTEGNSKNNVFGRGATIEIRHGAARQSREVRGEATHLGLGAVASPEVLRVVWTNGVPQNRLEPSSNQRVVEEQLLKGSCPFLYGWDGERFAFVTDLLWGAPLGLPVAEGVWAGADPSELVRVGSLPARAGRWELRITEELWEAAFFDRVRLWVVDHPAAVEVSSSLKILPGRTVADRVLGSRALAAVVAATDADGADVTARLAARDEVYADGWRPGRYQGVTAAPWALTFDLGAAPGQPVRLLLDGWIFPADASLNLAMAQRTAPPLEPTRLEVETGDGWRPLVDPMGFPAGKTKTMVVDTPPLPPGARRLRIVSSQWLSWDRLVWTRRPADGEPVVAARLAPAAAELRYRGFSVPVRRAPNAPHEFDYERLLERPPWLPFPGRYTRYGDVGELLAEADDRTVILAAGDELALAFDATGLAPPAAGWRRTLFLESHGWDKDADRNTWEAQSLEPLPFHAMSGYPYGPGETYPDSPAHRAYRERWLTRVVAAQRPESGPLPGGG